MENPCVEYAKNRMALNEIKKKIGAFIPGETGIDLSDFREAYYTKDFNPMLDNAPSWNGWVVALKAVGDYSKDEMELAELLDQKKELLREAGKIKMRVYHYGKGILRKRSRSAL